MLPPAQSAEQQRKRDAATARAVAPDLADKVETLAPTQVLDPETKEQSDTGADAERGEGESKDVVRGIPGTLKAKMEGVFGSELSHITLHTGPNADELCQKRGAVAFCQGETIYISSEAGTVGSPEFARILAHEITHVLQQQNDQAGEKGDKRKEGQAEAGEKALSKEQGQKEKAKGREESEEDTLKAMGQAHKATEGKVGAGAAAKAPETQAKGASLEGEADAAESKAEQGQKVDVTGKAPSGSSHNKKSSGGESVTTLSVPIAGRSIKLQVPSKYSKQKGDFSVSLNDIKNFGGKDSKSVKTPRKSVSIPTPCFGLKLELGIEAGAKYDAKALNLRAIRLSRKSGRWGLTATLASSLTLSAHGGLYAGLKAGNFLASAGIGLKAKLNLSRTMELTKSINISWGGKSAPAVTGSLAVNPFTLDAKFQGAAYVYFDTAFSKTYEKEWQFYERVLGKLSFASIGFDLTKSGRPFKGNVKGPTLQDFQGKIKALYPKKSK